MQSLNAKFSAIHAAVRVSGFEPVRVRCVARLDCEVWRIAAQDPAGDARELCLRIYPERKNERAPIESEVRWLRAAANDGLHVPRPVPDATGRLVRTWWPDRAKPMRRAVLLTWLGGSMLDRALTRQRLHQVGVLTARLHLVAAREVKAGRIATERLAHRAGFDEWIANAYPGSQVLGKRLRKLAAETALRLRDELAALPRDASSWGFIHGDLHPWNLLFTRDAAGAIDFSECGLGHRSFEFASTLQWLRHPLVGNHDHGGSYVRLQHALLDGYASIAPLPADVEREIDVFIVMRLLLAIEWILDDWPSLDHRPWGPGFLAACEGLFARFLRT